MPGHIDRRETHISFEGQNIPLHIQKNHDANTTAVTASLIIEGRPVKVSIYYNSAGLNTKAIKTRLESVLQKTQKLSSVMDLGYANRSISINKRGDITTLSFAGNRFVHYKLATDILGNKPSQEIQSLEIELDTSRWPSIRDEVEHLADEIDEPAASQGKALRVDSSKKNEVLKSLEMPVNKKCFTKDELAELKRLSPLINALKKEKAPLVTKIDKRILAALFAKSLGNKAFLRQVDQLIQDKITPAETKEALQSFREFAFRTRDLGRPLVTVRKIEGLIEKVHAREPIDDEDKLSLKELGGIEMFLKLDDEMRLIDKIGLPNEFPLFKELLKTFERGSLVLEQVNAKLDKYSNYKPGDIAFTDNKKYKNFRGEKPVFQEKLKTRVLKSPLHHVAVVMKGGNIPEKDYAPDELSHIIKSHVRDNFNLRNKCIYSVYRLEPEKLLTKDASVRTLLEEMYEDVGVAEGLQRDYQKIQNSLHGNLEASFQAIDNPAGRRLKSGLAEIFTQMHTKKASPGRFEKLHQKFFSEDADFTDKKMICSEFAAKTMLAGLIEEQALIKDKLVRFLIEKKGYTQEEAQELVQKLEIFKLPIPETERLSRMNPTRLLKLLTENECVLRVEHQPLIKMLVKENDLKFDPKEEVFPAAKTTGFGPDETDRKGMVPFDPSIIEPVEEEAPNTPPDNPSISDKLMNIDGGIAKHKFKILKKTDAHLKHIKERREEIKALKEEWRKKIELASDDDALFAAYDLEKEGKLKPLAGGMGGAYLLSDKHGNPAYILKPSDEDLMALNNRKCKATLESGESQMGTGRVRRGIPLYTTVQAEVLAYQVAKDLGFNHLTPRTAMVIFKSEEFHDIMDNVEELKGKDRDKILQTIGGEADREKLCSMQEFVPNSIELLEFLSSLQQKSRIEDLTAHQQGDTILRAINQRDFEDCLLFACVVGETDGNCGNYRLLPESVDEWGDLTYRMVKVDNALTFTEKNSEFDIFLTEFPQATRLISEQGREFLLQFNEEKINAVIDKMCLFDRSEEAVKAFKTRIRVLKECAAIEDITLKEICNAMNHSKAPQRAAKTKDGKIRKLARKPVEEAETTEQGATRKMQIRTAEETPFERQDTIIIRELPSQRNLPKPAELQREDTMVIIEKPSLKETETTIIHEKKNLGEADNMINED